MSLRRALPTALFAAVLATLALSSAVVATHPGGHFLFGDAEYVSPGHNSNRAVDLTSDADSIFGGIAFPADDLTFEELETLSTDFKIDGDDLCLGGSPRFQIGIDTDGDGHRDGNIFAYFGPESGGAACVPGTWQNTGDQLEAGRLLDTSQLPGGSQIDTYESALLKYGELGVTGVQIVVDAGWAHLDAEQTAQIDNTNIDGHLHDYELAEPQTADDCKDGGWEEMATAGGDEFRNQGDCVAYTHTGR